MIPSIIISVLHIKERVAFASHTPDVSPSVPALHTAAVTSSGNRGDVYWALKEFTSKLEAIERKSYLFLLTGYRTLARRLSVGKLNILISSPENASGSCYMEWEVEGWLIPRVPSK